MTKRNKKYNPTSKYNPAFQARKLDNLSEKIENHRKQIRAISKSHDNYISYLANFARHDIKNAIQSMDSILSTTKVTEFEESTLESLSTYLDVIRETIDNFAKLVPYSISGKFKLDTLINAVELLARADMQKHDIEFIFDYKRQSNTEIELPFQMILQMLNNLIINSIKALELAADKKILVSATINSDNLSINIRDNGYYISEENINKIFDYGFSTTKGSGIGLYHAKYLCDLFKGSIAVSVMNNEHYNKTFTITLPIIQKNGEDNLNN